MMLILVVDDEKEIRDSLNSILNVAGYEVETASNGEEALEFLGKDTPDMMLVDMSMPGISGLELVSMLYKERRMPPALVITALAPWKAIRLLKYGVGYIRKPVDSKLLLDTIGAVLGKEALNGHAVAC